MKKLLSIGLVLLLCACTTVIESDKTKHLVVSSRMDKSIFLVPVAPSQRVVFVDVKNFTEYPFFDIEYPIIKGMKEKGYAVTKDPSQAHFMIQANIFEVEEKVVENTYGYNIVTALKVSQRVPEGIYIRKIRETQQSKEDFSRMSFNYDEFEMTETLASDDSSLFWKTYQTKISTVTNYTELAFNEIANIIITKVSDIVISIF